MATTMRNQSCVEIKKSSKFGNRKSKEIQNIEIENRNFIKKFENRKSKIGRKNVENRKSVIENRNF
uniref:Uncharacterized protein n=1 Tax=Meloidogyne enterolobii TaxID=390850 RepID=A0A6V7UK01_MELEN|nr:unnamed protein product [Meloidogyne enterolobii]